MLIGNKNDNGHSNISGVFFSTKVVSLVFRKNGLLYASYEEYKVENTVDHQIRRIRQRRISRNIDRDLINYVHREERNGHLQWNP